MPCRGRRAPAIVDADPGRARDHGMVDHHQRKSSPADGAQRRRAVRQRISDREISLRREHPVGPRSTVVTTRKQEQRVPRRTHRGGERVERDGQRRVGEGRGQARVEHERDRPGALCGETAGDRVRARVAEAPRRAENLLP